MRTAGDTTKEGAMRKSSRVTVFACAAALALAVTALAAASYTPFMGIFQANYKPGGAGAVTVVVGQLKTDDPTARIVIYVPLGYTTSLGQSAGATIGTFVAHVQLLDTGSTNAFTFNGPVTADNPASYPAASNLCTPGISHEAVWVLNAALAGQKNPIPIYVDHTTGAEATFSSAKLTVCFRNPTLPQGHPARAPSGTKFLDATFRVRGVFKNPDKAARNVWRSVFTPYPVGSPIPNAAGTTEAQAVVPLPYSVTLRRVKARRGFFRVAGVVNISGQRQNGARVGLFTGIRTKSGITFGAKALTTTKTRRGGKFAFNRRLPRKTTFVVVQRLPAPVACAPSPLGLRCTSAIESNAISRVLKIAPPRKRRR
jgi:hypothetical protein